MGFSVVSPSEEEWIMALQPHQSIFKGDTTTPIIRSLLTRGAIKVTTYAANIIILYSI